MTIAVLGAGTMGSGIAAAAARGGRRVLLHDPDGAALASAPERIARALRAERDDPALALIELAALEDIAAADIVIEAAPERLEVKREVLGRALAICGPSVVLATNTSSLLVAAIAGGLDAPERLVGMHFFNPVPRMPLVEIVAGPDSASDALDAAAELARAMGKTPVRATDAVGFIVNRSARPFNGEALQLLAEGAADVATIDRVLREAAGFRMGPFELMDLVGTDVSLDIQRSFHAQSFGEPRWRPSELQANLVAAGRLGRKSGRGWHAYPHERPKPEAIEAEVEGPVAIRGNGALATELRAAAESAGVPLTERSTAWLTVEADPYPVRAAGLVSCAASSLTARGAEGAVGFQLMRPLGSCRLVELCRGPSSDPEVARRAEALAGALGLGVAWVGDGPGLVSGRVVAQLVNEAHFTEQRGIATREDIDLGMRLGLSWPRGPFEWGDALGLADVHAMLTALQRELGDDRYRPAWLLTRRALTP